MGYRRSEALFEPQNTDFFPPSRAEFEAVLGLEFGETSTKWLDENPDALGLTYGYLLHHWVKPA